MKNDQDNWEIEFDEEFDLVGNEPYAQWWLDHHKRIKSFIKKTRQQAVTEALERKEDKILSIMDEFWDQPQQCLAIIGEHIGLAQHFRANPNAPDPETQGM